MATQAADNTGVANLLTHKLVICVGCGGVGKTTTAAALALAGASPRRRTAVITVDPARRLKDALGLVRLSVDPVRVNINERGNRHFDALALDTKRAFDDLVGRMAGSEQAAQRILQNRLYQEISNELAGSAEYMAMEKLHELVHLHRYQFIVVDTPPSAHIQDLLAAPNRLLSLLATRAVSFLKAPNSLLGLADSTPGRMALSVILNALKGLTGLDLLADISDFVGGFEHMIDGFVSRAEEVSQLLRGSGTAFVLVTTPDSRTVDTTISFHRDLIAGGYPVAGIIANRVLSIPTSARDLEGDQETRLGRKLWRNYRELRTLAQRDEMSLQRLRVETGLPLLGEVPATVESPSSLSGLAAFSQRLVGNIL